MKNWQTTNCVVENVKHTVFVKIKFNYNYLNWFRWQFHETQKLNLWWQKPTFYWQSSWELWHFYDFSYVPMLLAYLLCQITKTFYGLGPFVYTGI